MRGDESREKRDFSHAFGPRKRIRDAKYANDGLGGGGCSKIRMTGYRHDEYHAEAGDGLRAKAIAIKRRETISSAEPRAAMARGTAP